MKAFWDKVYKTETCWIWRGAIRGKSGYGCLKVEGKTYNAHRFVWFLTYKQFPKKLVLHKCDNRLCVNPDHLFEGTQSDNMKDALKKGRIKIPVNIKEKHHGQTLYRLGCRCEICYRSQQEHNARRRNYATVV